MPDNQGRDRIEEVIDRLDRIEQYLTGNGEPERGLIVRMDRQEQRAGLIVKSLWPGH